MTRTPRRHRAMFVATLAIVLTWLNGCGILSQPPQRQLYRLRPAIAFPTPPPPVAAQLLVGLPTAGSSLDTARIAVSHSDVLLDYLADAEWPDRAPALVQAALVEGFEKSGAVTAVGPESLGVRADFVLDSQVRDFEAVYDSPAGAPHVLVALDAKLVKLPDQKIVAQTAIHQRQNAAGAAVPDIVRAFDAALGGAVQQAVGWTLANIGLPRRRDR